MNSAMRSLLAATAVVLAVVPPRALSAAPAVEGVGAGAAWVQGGEGIWDYRVDDRFGRHDRYGRLVGPVRWNDRDRGLAALRARLARQHAQWHRVHDRQRHNWNWRRQHAQLHERLNREWRQGVARLARARDRDRDRDRDWNWGRDRDRDRDRRTASRRDGDARRDGDNRRW